MKGDRIELVFSSVRFGSVQFRWSKISLVARKVDVCSADNISRAELIDPSYHATSDDSFLCAPVGSEQIAAPREAAATTPALERIDISGGSLPAHQQQTNTQSARKERANETPKVVVAGPE